MDEIYNSLELNQSITSTSYQYRLLAKKIIDTCPINFASEIALTGSAARGVADQDSDIELNCWIKEIPSLVERQKWLESIGAKEISFDTEAISDGSFWVTCLIENTWFEIGWQSEFLQQQLINKILEGLVLDAPRLINAGIVLNSISLRSNGLLSKWKEQLSIYPEVLSKALIKNLIKSWQSPQFIKVRWALARRGEIFALNQRLTQDINTLIRVLFATNKKWETNSKWLDLSFSQMPAKPSRLIEQINRVFLSSFLDEKVAITLTLIVETLKLIPPSPEIKKTIITLENSLKENSRNFC